MRFFSKSDICGRLRDGFILPAGCVGADRGSEHTGFCASGEVGAEVRRSSSTVGDEFAALFVALAVVCEEVAPISSRCLGALRRILIRATSGTF